MGWWGAAIATVIGQVAAGGLCLVYLRRLQSVRIRRAWLRPSGGPHGPDFQAGHPQLSHADYDRCRSGDHEQLDDPVWGPDGLWRGCGAFGLWHGDEGVPDCPRHVCGVSSATQPINGYNFGAKRYDRVRATYRMAAALPSRWWCPWAGSRSISSSPGHWHCLSQEPGVPGRLPASSGFTCWPFPLWDSHGHFLLFSRGIGRPVQALAIPLVRQAVVLIPLAPVVPGLWANGGAAGSPIADVVSFSSPWRWYCGSSGVGKRGALVSRRRWNRTAHRRPVGTARCAAS